MFTATTPLDPPQTPPRHLSPRPAVAYLRGLPVLRWRTALVPKLPPLAV